MNRIYALEVKAHTGYSETTLYYSSSPSLVTGPTDTPPITTFQPRIVQPGNYSTQAFQGGLTFGKSEMGYGEIVLSNDDGALDALLDYGFDGRVVVLRTHDADAAPVAYPAGWDTIFTGTIEQPEATWPGYNDSNIVLRLRDGGASLRVKLPLAVYAGDNVLPGGLEGTVDDLKGKTKPLLLGKCHNMALQCINTSKLIYAVSPPSGGAIDLVWDFDGIPDFDAEVFYNEVVSGPVTTELGTEYRRGGCSATGIELYDSGVALTYGGTYATVADLLATAPTAGQYKVMPAYGYVRLGSSPAGEITCTATDNNGSDANLPGSIIRVILRDYMQWDSTRFNVAELAAIDAASTLQIGHLIQQETYIDDLIDTICNSVGACYYFDSAGVFRIFRIADPTTATPSFTLGSEIMAIDMRSAAGIPPKTVRVKWQKNWTVQNSGLAGSVAADRRAWLANEWRENIANSPAIAAKHLLSDELEFDSSYYEDAQAECDRRLALYATRRAMFDLTIHLESFPAFHAVEIGQVVAVELEGRYGCTSKNMLITGKQLDLVLEKMIITVWG